MLVRDPLDFVKPGSAIEPSLLSVFQLLETGISIDELQEALTRAQGGVFVAREDCERLMASLDNSFLLDSPAYRTRRKAMEQEYAAQTVRSSTHAGRSYPADAEAVAELVDSIIQSGLDMEPQDNQTHAAPPTPLLGLVAPHIDIGVGHNGYSRGFAALAREVERDRDQGAPPIERIVILGVGHKLTDSLYSVTTKDYETPLGRLQTDADGVAQLAALGPPVVSASDWSHRDEHSIEFPALFLQRIFRNLPDMTPGVAVIPVLCGSAHLNPNEYSRAQYMTHAARFIDALADIVADDSRRTIVVASVDFCHIGPKFGHQQTAHTLETEATAHDHALLQALAAGDAAAFWEESARVSDSYNVCGFSAMATMLEALPKTRGAVLDYAVHHEDATRSAVTFAAVALRAV